MSLRKSSAQLNEELLSKKRAIELWDCNIITSFPLGSFSGLQQIHQYLFQDIFTFAGEIRTVNVAKGHFRFCPVLYLEEALQQIDSMPNNTFEEIIAQYVELNVAHPFREGNGRSMRIWLDALLRDRIGMCVDWANLSAYDYLQAMERSSINDLEIRSLLSTALTENIDNRDVYMRGIQSSYSYEGQSAYNIYDI